MYKEGAMRMIKRLICLTVLCFIVFFVGTMFSPNIKKVEKKEHQGVVIGHIVGQYQHIYTAQKTASIE